MAEALRKAGLINDSGTPAKGAPGAGKPGSTPRQPPLGRRGADPGS